MFSLLKTRRASQNGVAGIGLARGWTRTSTISVLVTDVPAHQGTERMAASADSFIPRPSSSHCSRG